VASISNHNLRDLDGGQQTSEDMATRNRQSGTLDVLDLLIRVVGILADEFGLSDCPHKKSSKMECSLGRDRCDEPLENQAVVRHLARNNLRPLSCRFTPREDMRALR
jgi:hypothetical protein